MIEAIHQIFETVTLSVLGVGAIEEHAVSSELARELEPPPAGSLVARVQIRGAWSGAVVLWCAPEFASLAANRMFETDDADEDSQRDALGELANMIAGNVKTVLPAPSELSLPVVGAAGDLSPDRFHDRQLDRVDVLVADAHRVVVALLTHDEPSPQPRA